MTLAQFFPAIGEIWLALSALMITIGGVLSKRSTWRGWCVVSLTALVFALVLMVRHYHGAVVTFDRSFVLDPLALAFKGMIAVGSFLAILLAIPFFDRRGEGKFEYPLLIVLATIGMFGMVSSQDFLSLYLSLELQSLSLYVLASFRRDVRHNSEAGLKYFFLGALSSGILLYGISLLYGFAGTTSYETLFNTLGQEKIQPAIIVGMVFVLCGVAFKIAAAPFHMWTPDVYQGSPTPVTALFSMAPKAAALGVLIRLVTGPLAPLHEQLQQILIALSLLSMLVGSFAAIAQNNVKRLLAYGAIGHVGFILLALAAQNASGLQAVVFYTATYLLMSAGGFAVVLAVCGDDKDENIALFSGLAKQRPVLAASFAALLLSMAGIPPLAGFLAKLAVFQAGIQSGLTWLAVVGLLCSVVSAFYYLRLIKIMYFDASVDGAILPPVSKIWHGIAIASAVSMLVLMIWPQLLDQLTIWATAKL